MLRSNKPPPPKSPGPLGRLKDGPKHWSQRVHETLVSGGPDGICNLPIRGGAENGKFCFLGDVKHERLNYHTSEKLHADEIILEVQGQKVGGFTLWDLQDWLKHVSKNGVPVMFKTVKTGEIQRIMPLFCCSYVCQSE